MQPPSAKLCSGCTVKMRKKLRIGTWTIKFGAGRVSVTMTWAHYRTDRHAKPPLLHSRGPKCPAKCPGWLIWGVRFGTRKASMDAMADAVARGRPRGMCGADADISSRYSQAPRATDHWPLTTVGAVGTAAAYPGMTTTSTSSSYTCPCPPRPLGVRSTQHAVRSTSTTATTSRDQLPCVAPRSEQGP